MSFGGLIHRKVASLLRPWLLEEPQLELKLGFLRSHGTVKNLRFDVSALNQLLEGSSAVFFEDVTVETLTLRISNWSVPAFAFEVHGVSVTLSSGHSSKDGRSKTCDSFSEHRKKRLASIDPEGSALHDVLERILLMNSSRKRRSTSLLNILVKNCRLQMHDIRVQVQIPNSDDCIACLFEMKQLGAQLRYPEHGVLLGKLIRTVIVPLEKSNFIINCRGFEIRTKRKDFVNCVLQSSDPFAFFQLKHLELSDFKLFVPESIFSFSPVDLSILLAFSQRSSDDSDCGRSGRELWQLASSRVGFLNSDPRSSFCKVVGLVILWLQYLNCYQHLLSQFSFLTNDLLRSSTLKTTDKKFSHSVQHQWFAMSEIEGKLPVKAIAQARRIARYRATLKVQHAEVHNSGSKVIDCLKVFLRIPHFLLLFWKILCSIMQSGYLLFLGRFLSGYPKYEENLGIVSDDHPQQFCFSLSFGKTSIMISPRNEMLTHVSETREACNFDLLSLYLSVDALLIIFAQSISQQTVSVACGQLKLTSSSIMETPTLKGSSDLPYPILWGEPAKFVQPSLNGDTEGSSEGTYCAPALKNMLERMWSAWKRSSMKYVENRIQLLEHPCILFEIRDDLFDPGLKGLDTGSCRCGLTVGKLNFQLGHSSILSVVVLLRQAQRALCLDVDSRVETPVSLSSRTTEDQLEKVWDQMEDSLFRVLPVKHIQLGAHIAGFCIEISPRNDQFQGAHVRGGKRNEIDFILNVNSIEIAVLPTYLSNLTCTGCPELDAANTQGLQHKEHHYIDIPQTENENYISKGHMSLGFYVGLNGASAGLRVSTEDQQFEIFLVNPITVRFCTSRRFLHTLSKTTVAVSAAFCGVARGFTGSLCMDELAAFFQVFFPLFSGESYVLDDLGSAGCARDLNDSRQRMALVKAEKSETTAEEACSMYSSIYSVLSGSFLLKSVYFNLYKVRSRNNLEGLIGSFEALNSESSTGLIPDCGIRMSFKQSCVQVSCEKKGLDLKFDLSGLQSILFRYRDQIGACSNLSELRNELLESMDCLYEAALSNCTSALWMGFNKTVISSESASNALSASDSGCKTICIADDCPSTVAGKRLSQKVEFNSYNSVSPSSHWFRIHITLSQIFVGSCSMKGVLVQVHPPEKLLLLLTATKDFQTINLNIQGGFLFIEILALVAFTKTVASYVHSGSHSFFPVPTLPELSDKADQGVGMTGLHIHSSEKCSQGMLNKSQAKWELVEAFTVQLSQFSLLMVTKDEAGGIKEFVVEADICLTLESGNMGRRFLFDLSCLSIFSQILHENREKEIPNLHLSRVTSSLPSPYSDSVAALCQTDGGLPVLDHLSCSNDYIFRKYSSVNNCASATFDLSHRNCILEQLTASISVQSPLTQNGCSLVRSYPIWVGSGFVSGLDITVSLSEVQIILSMVEIISGLLCKGSDADVKRKSWASVQEIDKSEETVPDGSIVAIQDVHQHMYITVEGGPAKYNLVGAVHYSLAGERALFKVKYHSRRIWKFPFLWFSLISSYAKSISGEALRLNYHSGSGFVDISCTADADRALWRMLPCNSKIYGEDIDGDPFANFYRKSFYLVNKKNDCSVAVVDGIPEFVKKPGNPFKFKVFRDFSSARAVVMRNNFLEVSETHSQPGSFMDEERISPDNGVFPHIDIVFEKAILTIVHELPNTRDKFPLLQWCICNFKSVIQILSSKARIMITLNTMLYYFDAHGNLWRELLHPVESQIFFRTNFRIEGSDMVLHGVPVHFCFKVKELNLCLTELSLDILLFVIGKLNLAGPFSVRASRILANCCKVENHSGIDLFCQFNDNQDVVVPGNRSTSIFLRHVGSSDQQHKRAPTVSVQLSVPGTFSTSPIQLSLLESQALAWRTRIQSLQGARSYPGPFVLVDVLRKSEDGLSIVVSPLVKIHNETQFPLMLRFQRPQQKEVESASLLLKSGDAIDDSMTLFDAINLSGGLRKALMSLSVGNFLFSFRPEFGDNFRNSKESITVDWSDDLKGGKAVRLSGLFDKLSYKVRKALSVKSSTCSFSTAHCSLLYEDAHSATLHFLIQSIKREVPVLPPDNLDDVPEGRSSPVALQEQKEIFLLPTVRVFNLLELEIHVLLTEIDDFTALGGSSIGNEATIPHGSAADFYVNPALIYFTVTLTAFSSRCKPVNSSEWVKKLQKQKNGIHFLDIVLNFDGGKYSASLRFSRGHRGILEAAVYTPYTLKNDTEHSLYLFTLNYKHPSREEAEKFASSILPEKGSYLPPKATCSWFLKSNTLYLKLFQKDTYEALLDLDALSGLTEISLETEDAYGIKYVTKLGLSLGPTLGDVVVPSQTVIMVPRFLIVNESDEVIHVRQCYLEDEMEGIIAINSKQKASLQLRHETSKRRAVNLFNKLVKTHRNSNDDSVIYIQFRLNEPGIGWSGPLCVTSLGRFFLKFRRSLEISPRQLYRKTKGRTSMQSDRATAEGSGLLEFAAVNVVEEGSSLRLHFHRPMSINLPYRIENCLHVASITYYQKESLGRDVLGSGSSVGYAWDDLTLPHKLIVVVNDVHLLREINLDKVRKWKPFFNFRQHKGLASNLLLDKQKKDPVRSNFGKSTGVELVKVGYEVYADGLSRVLRISEFPNSHKEDSVFVSCAKIQLRVSHVTLHVLEHVKQELDTEESSVYTPIVIARLGNISLDSLFTDEAKYNQIILQSLNVEQKWLGAPSVAVLRRHQRDYGDTNNSVLQVVVILLSTTSNVRQVKYSTIILQPLELNLDEETLMRLVPFWRKSLSDSNSQSRQFYFDHFEIHPIKMIASFLPRDSYSSYSTGQETLRSLLHSVIKIPAIKNMIVELNGVLVTHALITIRDLFFKCARHYSWYAMRAIYIAKGSPFLPPAFASIFDDLASSSLDVYFDPSHGFTNLPGLTLGAFKLISRCIEDKGFSGTKRYFGDLGKTLKAAGSNVLFAAVTEISDSVLKGAESGGLNGMVNGFHQGMLKLAMEPSVLGTAFMEGGPERKIKLDRSLGIDELYIEGYLQAMLDTIYKQEYLRVRVIDNQVLLKNLPPNSSLIDEIMDRVKGFLVSKALLKGDTSTAAHPLHHLRGESEWKIGPTVLTLCEHLFVSFAIQILRNQAGKIVGSIKLKKELKQEKSEAIMPAATTDEKQKPRLGIWNWGIGKFVLSGMLAYVDGRLCRSIPNPIARRIVSGFLLSYLDKDDT